MGILGVPLHKKNALSANGRKCIFFVRVGLFAAPFGRCSVRAYAIRPYCAPASRQLLSLTLVGYIPKE